MGTLLVGGASLQLTRWVGLFMVTCSACTERWVEWVSCDGHVTWGRVLQGPSIGEEEEIDPALWGELESSEEEEEEEEEVRIRETKRSTKILNW